MPTATADDVTTGIAGWQGMIMPYGMHTPVGDPRVVYPTTYELARDLPIPVTFQEHRSHGHDGAIQGLATITRVWQEDDGLYASGVFDLDDPRGRELARKIDAGFLGWGSADLETDGGTWERMSDGTQVPAYRTWRLMGYTLVPDSAFAESRITIVRDPAQITTVEQLRSQQQQQFAATPTPVWRETVRFSTLAVDRFVLVGDVDLPWAPREHAWDGPAAARRVQEWADGDGDRMARAFLWRVPDADPTTQAAYKLGFADVIDGELRAVYRGVAAAAGRLDQADIPADGRDRVRARIDTLYERAARALDDPTIDERTESMADESADAGMPMPEPDTGDTTDDTTDDGVTISQASIAEIVDAVTEAVTAAVTQAQTQAATEAERMAAARDAIARLRTSGLIDGGDR